jgi:2,5-diketo-D-gluconate reductase A
MTGGVPGQIWLMTGATTHALPLTSGGRIPILGLGTWQLSGAEAYETVRTALDLGYRHLDTATMYGNEAEIGSALADSGVPREDVFVTTKLPAEAVGREQETLEASLRAVGTDYVDLWLIHWPPNGDAAVPTWEAFLELRRSGAARDVGVSNYGPELIDELIAATAVAPAVNQVKWSPVRYDAARLAHSRERGVVLEGYSPFRAGRLDDPVLEEIAALHGVSTAQVVLRWHVEHGVVVIPKSARPERLASNLDVFGFSLSAEEVARIDGLSESA